MIFSPRRLQIVLVTVAVIFAVGCSSQQPPPAPDPAALLQAIPPADAARYEHIQDMKKWQNPYILVRADGVALYDSADSAEIAVKPDDLLATLAQLPASNWPYGRVVAAAVGARASEQEGVAIRRNKGIVGGILEGAHIAVKWVPST